MRDSLHQRVDKVDTLGKTNEKAVRRGTATQTVRWYGNGAVLSPKVHKIRVCKQIANPTYKFLCI